MKVEVKRLTKEAVIPKSAHDSDFGYDVTAVAVEKIGFLTYRYRTGLSFGLEIPSNEYKIGITARPRSSVWKTGMLLVNTPGTIDRGYTGEVSFVFIHIFPFRRKYKIGERIGQIHLDVAPVMDFVEVSELAVSERGAGREGSTGK